MPQTGGQDWAIEAEHVATTETTGATRKRRAKNQAPEAIELDDCPGFAEPSAGRALLRAHPQKPGPRGLAEVLSMRPAVAAVDQRSLLAGVDVRRTSTATLGQVTFVTTSYSGIGTAEAAVAEVARQLNLTGSAVVLRMHGAVERDPKCLEALQLHRPCSKSEHIFQDVNDRIPSELARRLLQRAALLRRKVALHVDRVLETLGKVAADDARAKWVSELGSKFLDQAKRALGKLDWSKYGQFSWCVRHGRMCPLKPAVGPRDAWIEIAGSTCVAWSTMGAGWGWLDASTVPCLTWAYWAASAEPDCIVHENVRPFDWKFFEDPAIFAGRYWVASQCHSPVDQGIPANRPRRYTVLLSKRLALQHQSIPRDMIVPDTGHGEINPLRAPQFVP